MVENSIYSNTREIFSCKFASLDVYHMKPGTVEKTHYHKGLEAVFVLSGSSKTHKKGRFYLYRSGQRHEVINDSPEDLAMACLTIPAESKENTVFI